MRLAGIVVTAALCALPLAAQGEFLTSSEIEQIREAQEPNVRVKTYLLFARQRLDQMQQQIAKDKKGRSLEIRRLLEDYTQIIDAIDTVSDDALKRKVDITEGIGTLAAAEEKFAAILHKIEDSQPRDLEMYSVALKDAIGSTTDSLETAKEDMGARAVAVAAKAEKEKKEVESYNPPGRAKEVSAEEAKADDGKPKRKPPTLYRPGEKPAEAK